MSAQKQEFLLTEEHLKLLSRMSVRWWDCETGAPAIDPKRPYGNSAVVSDIAEILGVKRKKCPHCAGSLDEGGEVSGARLTKLHRETEIALQIVLRTRSFVPGKYVRGDHWGDWRLLGGAA